MAAVAWSFYKHLHIISFLLYLQSILLALSNYNNYDAETNPNFEGLNMVSTVFSVIYCILNCYLASLVVVDFRVKGVATMFIFAFLEYIIIDTNFNWDDTTTHSMTSIIIACVYTVILVPLFGYITNSIINETLEEARLSY